MVERVLDRARQQLRRQIHGPELRIRLDVRVARHHGPRRTAFAPLMRFEATTVARAELRFHIGTHRNLSYSTLDAPTTCTQAE